MSLALTMVIQFPDLIKCKEKKLVKFLFLEEKKCIHCVKIKKNMNIKTTRIWNGYRFLFKFGDNASIF